MGEEDFYGYEPSDSGMSLSLGQNDAYINKIENKNAECYKMEIGEQELETLLFKKAGKERPH